MFSLFTERLKGVIRRVIIFEGYEVYYITSGQENFLVSTREMEKIVKRELKKLDSIVPYDPYPRIKLKCRSLDDIKDGQAVGLETSWRAKRGEIRSAKNIWFTD